MSWWPSGQEWRPHERLWFSAPQWQEDCWWRISGWRGGDEYGNLSVYLSTGLLGGVVFFYELDFQRDVEMPEPGVSKWVDRRYYNGGKCPGACHHFREAPGCDGYPDAAHRRPAYEPEEG